MKKKIFYILFILPFILFAQEMDINHHNIKINNYINLESNDLNTSFLNTMLFGGFITDEMKDKWTTIIFHTKMGKAPGKGFSKMYNIECDPWLIMRPKILVQKINSYRPTYRKFRARNRNELNV